MITGLCLADSLLPIGCGQRQLILGDRFIGKTSIFITVILANCIHNYVNSIDGLGTKKLFAVYIGINQNLSKIFKLISVLRGNLVSIYCTHSSSSCFLSFIVPLCGIRVAEKLQSKGFNVVMCFDDLNLHAKSYRQISLLLSKIPSREAYSADIFNIHSSLLERCSNLTISGAFITKGSITSLPICETINNNISDFICTNIISITDGQFYLNKKLFTNSIRPAFDSALSVSRVGSAAQNKLLNIVSVGIKNTLTYLRKEIQLNAELKLLRLLNSLNIIFNCKHLFPQPIEYSIILFILYNLFSRLTSITYFFRFKLEFLLCFDLIYLYYLVLISKNYFYYLKLSLFNAFINYFIIFYCI